MPPIVRTVHTVDAIITQNCHQRMRTVSVRLLHCDILLICDNTFFLISLFKMRHVIFSLNEYVVLCYVMSVDTGPCALLTFL